MPNLAVMFNNHPRGANIAAIVLRLPQVKAKAGLSRSAIYSLEKTGDFPARIPLGARSVGWLESEVQAWIESRVAARKGAK